MGTFVDLRQRLPGLRGTSVHVLPSTERERLSQALREEGFRSYEIDGAAVSDEEGFMREAARALALPDWFGANWDALRDCLFDLFERPERRVAVVWTRADVCLGHDVQAFADALLAFKAASVELMTDAGDDTLLQLEVFALGDGAAFAPRPR